MRTNINYIVLTLLLLLTTASIQGQNLKEWTQQKKTQKQYLLQQIAALQIYISYVKKGYQIAKQGLNTIGGFTKGEWDLHTDYINSLKTVNPTVKRYSKVADIIALQVKIVQNYNRYNHHISSSQALTSDEQGYVRNVYGRLLADCQRTLDELINVTTDGRLEMKDDERIARIDKLHRNMQDNYTFSQAFGNDTKTFAASRIEEQGDIQTGRALHGIK